LIDGKFTNNRNISLASEILTEIHSWSISGVLVNRRSFVFSPLAAAATFPVCAQSSPDQSEAGPGFRPGVVTYNTLKDLDLETIIQVLETTGFRAVELRTGHKHGIEPSIGMAERLRVRRRFEVSKVRLLSYGTTCRFQSPDPAERRKQVEIGKQFADLAHDTGALAIKLQPMGLPPEVPRAESIAYFGAAMSELGDHSASRGVEVWMEVHGKGTSDPPTAAALLKAANHRNVGACWNCNPTDVQNGSVKESFALLQKWIRNVHLHELSDATYPYRELFALLKTAGYSRYTLAEVAESKELERYLRDYRALWTELNRSCV
jgi:sugar phosphate isomerase/epimerase